MWNLVSRIFATPKSIDKAMDAVIATGDKLWFTEEEKADNSNKMADWFLKYLEATQPQAISRRFLAMMVGGLWTLTVLLNIIFGLLGMTPQADFLFKTLTDVIATPFAVIMGFYFAGHYLKQLTGK